MKKNKKNIHNNSILERNERCSSCGEYPYQREKFYYCDSYCEHIEMPYEDAHDRVQKSSDYFRCKHSYRPKSSHYETPSYPACDSHREKPSYRSYYSHYENRREKKKRRNPLKMCSIIVWVSILIVFAGLSIWNSVTEVNASNYDIPETRYINPEALTLDEHGNQISIVDDIFKEKD